jgi:phosphoesterase RecJ-like protein
VTGVQAASPDIEALLDQAAAKIAAADRILVTCHAKPDGDSAGSMVALASMLRERGKRATLFSPERVPRFLAFLPLRKSWTHALKAEERFQLTCILDCGDEKLLGPKFPAAEITGERIVLDHHAHGEPFGDLFISDPGAAASGVLVWRLAKRLGWTLTSAAATGLYVALISDTGSFRYANTNAEAFALAGELVESGLVVPAEIADRMSQPYTGARLKLISKVVGGIERELGGRVAIMTITHKILSETGAGWDDTDGLIHYVRNLRGAMCGVFMSPAKHGGIRVSMRARSDGLDVGAVCAALGGGGHPGAAGCTLQGELADARVQVVEAIEKALKGE